MSDILASIDRLYGTKLGSASGSLWEQSEVDQNDGILHLLRCKFCDLHFFDPMMVGNSNFYGEIGAAGWSRELRWDHRMFLRSLRSGSTIIDLGGGNDIFQRAVNDKGSHCISIDFAVSPSPYSDGKHNIEADLGDIDQRAELVKALGPQADFVTAFHVLEHLPDPVDLASFGSKLLKPGGSLVVSVPNRNRFDVSLNQSLECPPHHQTRWSAKQLRLLGVAVKATDVQVRREIRCSPKIVVGGPIFWLVQKNRNPVANVGTPGRPWPVWHIPQGLSLIGHFRF